MRALESEGLNLTTSSGMFSLEQGLHIKRDTAAHSKNLRHFLGLKANELSPTCLVKMDEAGELEAAAHEVGLTPETSLPNRWPHNAELERDIRNVADPSISRVGCHTIYTLTPTPLCASPCHSTDLQHSTRLRPNGKA